MNEENEYSKSDRIKFALQWLGYDGVTLGKRFNTEKFAEGEKEVIETSSNPEEADVDSRIALIYDRASGKILYLDDKVLDYIKKNNLYN